VTVPLGQEKAATGVEVAHRGEAMRSARAATIVLSVSEVTTYNTCFYVHNSTYTNCR
jgi:hypothetical protein